MAEAKVSLDEYRIYQTDLLTDRVVENLRQQGRRSARPIFNYQVANGRDDKKRRQCNLAIRSKYMRDFYGHLLEFLEGTILRDHPDLKPTSPVVLLSKPGCQEQAAHSDYVPDTEFRKWISTNPPYLAILALTDGTKLNIWPGSAGLIIMEEHRLFGKPAIPKTTLRLKKGELLIFRGDLVHAGSAYEEENIRLHIYLDSPKIPRVHNRTWVIHGDGNEELQRIVEP
jgi:hypothetical protein